MIVRTNITSIFKRMTLGFASFALVLGSVSAAVPVFLTQQANAVVGSVVINNIADLRNAVAGQADGQADGQTWTINAGNYGLDRFNDITVEKETGWYLPITANNLTINGVGNPTLFGKEYSTDGNWSSQNLVSIFGDNVTLNGLTLMPKVEPNKTIEVLGANATIKNVVITPNTLTDQSQYDNIYYSSDPSWTQDAKTWGGSLYFSHAGNHTVENVTIKNSGVSFRYTPSGTHVTFINTKLDFATNVDWINQYRYSSGFDNPGSTITGAPQVTYNVNSTLNNLDSVLASAQNGDTVNINSNLTVAKQITIAKALTINGNGNTVSPSFTKTDNGNNSVLGIQSNGVTVNDLTVNGTGGTNLHGVNVYTATGVNLNNVTSKNNNNNGVVVNSSTVAVSNINTSGNGWGGIDVDQKATPASSLIVNGTSTHRETAADIYIDDTTKAVSVNDTNAQYGFHPSGLPGRSNGLVYKILLAAPTVRTPADNSYTNNSSFDNSWSVVSGAVKYEYETTYMLNGTTQTYADTSASSNYVVGPTAVTRHNNGAPQSTYTWKVRGVDALGIKGSWSTDSKVTVDTTKPVAPLNGQPGVTGTNDFYFTWSPVTDNGSPVVEYQFQSSGSDAKDSDGSLVGAWKNWTSYVTPEQKTLTTPTIHSTGAPDGTYYWQARAVDAAGNFGAWSQVWDTRIDRVAPTATLVFPTPGPTATGFKVKFSEAVNANDATNTANYFLENWIGAGGSGDLNGDATATYDAAIKTATVTFKNADWYVSAEQKWGVTGIHDLAGNLIVSTSAFSTKVENPTNPGVPYTTSPTNKSAATWNWSPATDPGGLNGSGIKGYEYALTLNAATPTDWTFTNNTNAVTSITEGSYTLYVRAIDNAGNKSEVTTGQVVVDNTPPATPENLTVKAGTVSLTNPGRTNSYGITTSWDSVYDATKYQYRVWNDITGSVFKDQESAYITAPQSGTSLYGTFNLGEGTHYIQVRSIDASGNQSPWSITPFVVTYDKTAPIATIKTIATNDAKPVITGTLNDPSVTDLVVTLDGKNLDGVTRTGADWSVSVVTPLVDGTTYKVVATGTDTAGNQFTTTQSFTTKLPVATTDVETSAAPVAPVATSTAAVAPQPLQQNLVALTTPATVADATTTPEAEVLGASTTKKDPTDVAGVSTTKADVSNTDSKDGLSAAWWWLLTIPAAGATWWAAAAFRNRNS